MALTLAGIIATLANGDKAAILIPMRRERPHRMAQHIRHVGRARAESEVDIEFDAGAGAARQHPDGRNDHARRLVENERSGVDWRGGPRGVVDARRGERPQWSSARLDAAVIRPLVQHQAPGLRDQSAACHRFDMASRRCDQRRDDRIVIIVLGAQESLGLFDRPWLDRRAGQEYRRHRMSSL